MQVMLFISGRNLKNKDTFTFSDPKCTVFEHVGQTWVKRGKTEQKKNTLNPDFETSITLNYYFERSQTLKFVVEDDDGGKKQEIGVVVTSLAAIMGKKA